MVIGAGLALFLTALVGYLLGSVSGAILLARARGIEIREHGSGNAGGTNALRVLGKKAAAVVVLIDAGKGALAVALAAWVGAAAPPHWQAMAAIAGATAGHVWPLYFGFRGGKGAATLLGGLLFALPSAVLGCVAVWLCMLFATGFVGLATICAGLAFPAFAALFAAPRLPWLVFALAVAAFIVYTHRANLSRLRAGTEPRFEKLWLLRRRSS